MALVLKQLQKLPVEELEAVRHSAAAHRAAMHAAPT
jgi:hypothetical protein